MHYLSFWEELGSLQGIISCHPASPCPWHPKLIRVQLGTDHGPVLFPELQQEGHWHCPDGSGLTLQCALVLQLFSFSPNSSIWYSPSVAPLWCLSFFCLPGANLWMSCSKLCQVYHTPSPCSSVEITAEELLIPPPRRYTTSAVTWSPLLRSSWNV